MIEKGKTDEEKKEIRKVLEERIKIVIGIETENKMYEWKHAILVKYLYIVNEDRACMSSKDKCRICVGQCLVYKFSKPKSILNKV